MIFRSPDSSRNKSSSIDSAYQSGDNNSNKVIVIANALFNSIAMLLENLKLTRASPENFFDASLLLDPCGASSNTKIGTNAGITIYDCIIGGTATIGMSIALIQFSTFVWKRFLVKASVTNEKYCLNSGTKNSKTQHSIDCGEPMEPEGRRHKDNEANPSKNSCHHSANVSQGLQVILSEGNTNSTMAFKGSCQCKAIQFILKHQGIIQGRMEQNSSLSNCVFQASEMPGKIRFPSLTVHDASKNFELNPSSITFLRIYHVSSSPSLSPFDAKTFAALSEKLHVFNSAHAFCSVCGVHILYARDGTSDDIEVNVSALDGDYMNSGDPKMTPNVVCSSLFHHDETATNVFERTPLKYERISSNDCDHVPNYPFKISPTPVTEGTTTTASFSSDYTRSFLNDGSTSSTLDSECSSCTALFEGIHNRQSTHSFDDGVLTWPVCERIAATYEHSDGAQWKPPTPITEGGTGFMSIPMICGQGLLSTSKASVWTKQKRAPMIDCSLKHSLQHYMKKHLA